uniref:Uncharacterized protein n=1 Tax=Knipowitschia caucasica TaxID=637954 RepID=A0AAV2LJ24_KNICA
MKSLKSRLKKHEVNLSGDGGVCDGVCLVCVCVVGVCVWGCVCGCELMMVGVCVGGVCVRGVMCGVLWVVWWCDEWGERCGVCECGECWECSGGGMCVGWYERVVCGGCVSV